MWWTQPRLTVVACLLYFAASLAIVTTVGRTPAQTPALALVGVVIVLTYRAVSRELAARHDSGRMRTAFDGAVWQARWATPGFMELSGLASVLESETGFAEGRPDGERFHGPLARATSTLEAARLRAPANWIVLAIGLGIGWLAVLLPWHDSPNRDVIGGWLVPLVVSSNLGLFVDRAAARALVRDRSVQRVAALVPRTLGDLGLSYLGHPLRLVLMLGSATFMAAASWYVWPDVVRAAVGASIAAYLGLMIAAEQFALHRLPLLRFAGPPEISVFIDHQVRAARIRMVSGPGMFFVVAVAGASGQMDLLTGLAAGLFTSAHVLFAFNPDQVAGRRSTEDLATHLQDLARRWGLSQEAAATGLEAPVELPATPR